jgi:hypothetical protein
MLESARRFAVALDGKDYEAARACLASAGAYHSLEGVLIGTDRIVASYLQNALAARDRFEKIEYHSVVESAGETEAVITFIDRVLLGGKWHEYRCCQRVRIGASGTIEEIWHQELPGERERLEQFEAAARGRRGV